jgi:Protein of unknown function (DUF4242)
MPSYLVESYLARTRAVALDGATKRANEAAEAMRTAGIVVRHVRSTFLPDDEVCLHLFEAESLEAVTEVTRRAAIPYDRIVEAIESQTPPGAADDQIRSLGLGCNPVRMNKQASVRT